MPTHPGWGRARRDQTGTLQGLALRKVVSCQLLLRGSWALPSASVVDGCGLGWAQVVVLPGFRALPGT